MNIALVDDEKKYLAEMSEICRDYGRKRGCNIEIFPYSEVKEFLNAASDTIFSVVFMDIYMGETDGISAARKLREKDSGCVIIFLTASGEFMPEAFSCHAFEYLSKPIDRGRVEKCLDDAAKILLPPEKFVEIASDRKMSRVFLRDIVSAVTDAHYLEISLTDGSKLRCRMTVTDFQSLVGNDTRFILANRGVLLNAEHILSFESGCCVMDSGTRLPLRVKDAGRVEQAVSDYNFDAIRRRQNMPRGRE